jgi:hypothetical protein
MRFLMLVPELDAWQGRSRNSWPREVTWVSTSFRAESNGASATSPAVTPISHFNTPTFTTRNITPPAASAEDFRFPFADESFDFPPGRVAGCTTVGFPSKQSPTTKQ